MTITFLRIRALLVLLTLSLAAPATLSAQTGLIPGTQSTERSDTASGDAASGDTGSTAAASATTPQSSLQLLLDVIENPQSRDALIADLRAAQTSATPADEAVVRTLAGDNPVPPEQLSFSRRIALITQETVEDIASRAETTWNQLMRAPAVFDGLSGREAGVLLTALQELALIIVGTVAVFIALRLLGKVLYARMGAAAGASGFLRTALLFIGSVLVDALFVLAAWAVGYLIATVFLGSFGRVGIRETLYLNAFLIVELAKVVVRLALSPSASNLRPLPVSDEAAKYMASRFNLMVGLVGYGQLLIVPIINANVSFAAGSATSAVIALIAMGLAFWLVWRNRRPVADWLQRGGQTEAQYLEAQRAAEEAARLIAEEEAAQAEATRLAALAESAAREDGSTAGAPSEFTMSEAAAQEAAEEKALVAEQAAGEAAEREAEERAAREAAAEASVQAAMQAEEAETATQPAAAPTTPHMRGPLGVLARNWYWPVSLYLLFMLVIVLTRPGNAAFRALVNSGQVLIVVLLGVIVSGALTRIMVRGVQLPENVTARMPLLETRLNAFVPKALFVLRLAIFVVVFAFALNAISVIDMRSWLASQIGLRLTSVLFSVAGVLLMAFILWVALTSWVDYRLNPEFGTIATARERTLLTLLRNAATIALVVITLMFVLSEIGLDIAPLLASAGVLGLAIGFGAQKMVQDIITGIFIQFENAMNVGDVVTVAGTTGVVERLTIRSVSLRDVTGAFHVIPFSSVDMVTNFAREFGYFVCDMGVAYREKTEDVKKAMFDAFEKLRTDPDYRDAIMGDLEWFGINAFGDSAVVMRARIKCVPGMQWGVGRAYNGVVKEIFDARNIEIPFPHQTLFLGESKAGETQEFKLRLQGDGQTALPGSQTS